MARRRRGSQASAEPIPDELRCKRSDGKSWRCGERAAPGKSMCEKHFKQAKKRAAASAARQSAAKRLKGEPTKNKLQKETTKGAKHKRSASSDTELESDDGTDASSDSASLSASPKHNSDDNDSFLPLKRQRGASSLRNNPSSKNIDDSPKKIRKSLLVEHEERSEKKAKCNDDTDDSQGRSRKAVDDSKWKTRESEEKFKKVRKNVDHLEKNTKHHSKLIEKVDDPERKVRFKDEPAGKGSERKFKANKEDSEKKVKQKHQNKDKKMGEMCQDFSITDDYQMKGQPASSAMNAKDPLVHVLNAMEKSSSSSEKAWKTSKDGKRCHQCQGTNMETIIQCQKCKSKQYCSVCIRRWYPKMTEDDFSESCPACLGNCNCKACLRVKLRSTSEERTKPSDAERILTFRYILSFLLPLLRSLDKQQCDEIELEVKLKGTSGAELKRTKLNPDERLLCDNCNTSIVDLYRSCPDCNYDLCLLCSQELREGKLLSNKQVNPLEKVNNDCMEVQDSHFQIWRVNEDGCIPCPPKENGGCGAHELILRHIAKHGWITKLVKDVEAAVEGEMLVRELFEPCNLCSAESVCSSDHQRCVYQTINKSTPRNKYIYCPSALSIDKNTLEHFQKHWLQGEPVIVRDVLHSANGLNWEPMVFLKAFLEKMDNAFAAEKKIVKGLNCLNWSEVDINIQQFFERYQDGYVHKDGSPELLKLKDWPPPNFFYECLPSHGTEFISVLPFHDYTHPTRGLLNLVTKIPSNVRKPNLGPKTHIGYGIYKELGRGNSVMKLHRNIFDAVNVLTHCTEAKGLDWQCGKLREVNKGNESDLCVESTVPAMSAIEQIKPRKNDPVVKEQRTSEAMLSVRIVDGASEATDSRLIQAANENLESDAGMFSENASVQASEAVDTDNVKIENVEQFPQTKGINESIDNATIKTQEELDLDMVSPNNTMTSVQVEHAETQRSGSINGNTEHHISADNPQKCHDQVEDTGYSELLVPSVEYKGTIDVPPDAGFNSLDVIQQRTFPSEINNEDGCKDVSTGGPDHDASDITVGNEEDKLFENTVLTDRIQEDMLNDGSGRCATGMMEQEDKSVCLSRKVADAEQLSEMDSYSQRMQNDVEDAHLMNVGNKIISEIKDEEEESHHVILERSTLETPVSINVKRDLMDEHSAFDQKDCCLKVKSEGLHPVKDVQKDAIHDNEIMLGSAGALWDIFHREDVPKLQMYLEKHWREFQLSEEKSHAHAILDQSIFLTHEHKRRLKEEYGVEAWTFEQHSGEAVFIPAGCPHQVRNMKSCISVALDFVSPETVQESVRLSEEYRQLPKGHDAKEDELEIKRIVIFAAAAVLKQLNHLMQLHDKQLNGTMEPKH